jgi:hypothetical protein
VVTVTDSRHSLFAQQLTVLSERSGRGPAFVVVELPDGRRRSIRIASTDLGRAPPAADQNAADLPRVSVRTLIPLTRHLNAKLSLFAEEVIRDDHPSPSTSRSVSAAVDSGLRNQPAPDIINPFISISTFTRHIGEMVFGRRSIPPICPSKTAR